MPEVTEQSRVPFGRLEKGRRLCDCSNEFLQWMVDHLTDTDHHIYGFHARNILKARAKDAASLVAQDSLEAQADELLRNAGYGHLCGPGPKGPGRRRTRR